jgi:glycosyltransferase involved in cell wall biosynthesis
MRIAVLIREIEGLSLIRYRECVINELRSQGVVIIPFEGKEEAVPQCDIAWDPGMGRNRLPSPILNQFDGPLVITLHGSATFTMKWHEVYSGPLEAIRDKWANETAMKQWKLFRKKISAVIAVSKFGATEAAAVYNLPKSLIFPIYHGVDNNIFFPQKKSPSVETNPPFLLHVSAYQPKKNLERLLVAYTALPEATRPKLIIVAPGIKKAVSIPKVSIIRHTLSSSELANMYNQALGFVFPSLHETFGLPIMEAMACGCPVITSFDTACAEVAGDAALLIDPRSVEDIATAMARLIEEQELRDCLSRKGMEKAAQFTWARSAQKHLNVFRHVL